MHRLSVSLLILLAGSGHAAVCTVPGAYSSLQAAINDTNCSDIRFGPGQFEGSLTIVRSLTLSGSGSGNTNLSGNMSVSGNNTSVYADGFKVSGGCAGSWLTSSGGGSLWGSGLIVELTTANQCPLGEVIFDNGFEGSQ